MSRSPDVEVTPASSVDWERCAIVASQQRDIAIELLSEWLDAMDSPARYDVEDRVRAFLGIKGS